MKRTALIFFLIPLLTAVLLFTGGLNAGADNSPAEKKYFTDNSGAPATGWRIINGKRYILLEGKIVTGWTLVDGRLRCFGDDGVMLNGWQEIDGRKYYFDIYGVMLTGEYTVSGRDYCFGSDGALTLTSEYYGGNVQKFTRGMSFGSDDQLAAVKAMEFEVADYDETNVWFVPCDDALGVYTFDEEGILDGCTLVYSGDVPGSTEAGLFFAECGWTFSEADSISYDSETYVYISPDGRLRGWISGNGTIMEIELIINS